ncbi:MAG: hypothetical protein ACK4F4_02195 [Hylemonella sp.]|uniref:hypothetical protein n=1 Tax=Hylemonella sp. TaxID=2066020 RepID=UPI003918E2F9
MPSRAEEHVKTVLQWLAIALLALIIGIILHKGYVDIASLAEAHSGADFWRALARHFFKNLSGG